MAEQAGMATIRRVKTMQTEASSVSAEIPGNARVLPAMRVRQAAATTTVAPMPEHTVRATTAMKANTSRVKVITNLVKEITSRVRGITNLVRASSNRAKASTNLVKGDTSLVEATSPVRIVGVSRATGNPKADTSSNGTRKAAIVRDTTAKKASSRQREAIVPASKAAIGATTVPGATSSATGREVIARTIRGRMPTVMAVSRNAVEAMTPTPSIQTRSGWNIRRRTMILRSPFV